MDPAFLDNLMIWIIVPMLVTGIVMAFIRVIRGPSLPDRVVALDLLSAIAVSMMAVYAIASGQEVFLDVALIVALITFLGTIGFAYYINRRQRSDKERNLEA